MIITNALKVNLIITFKYWGLLEAGITLPSGSHRKWVSIKKFEVKHFHWKPEGGKWTKLVGSFSYSVVCNFEFLCEMYYLYCLFSSWVAIVNNEEG